MNAYSPHTPDQGSPSPGEMLVIAAITLVIVCIMFANLIN